MLYCDAAVGGIVYCCARWSAYLVESQRVFWVKGQPIISVVDSHGPQFPCSLSPITMCTVTYQQDFKKEDMFLSVFSQVVVCLVSFCKQSLFRFQSTFVRWLGKCELFHFLYVFIVFIVQLLINWLMSSPSWWACACSERWSPMTSKGFGHTRWLGYRHLFCNPVHMSTHRLTCT